MRKAFPGQVLAQSKEGSDLHLSDDVTIANAIGNELLLRSDDGIAVLNSYGHVLNGSGFRKYAGPITRNSYVIDDHLYGYGDSLVDPTDYEAAVAARLVRPITLENGKVVNYVTNLPISPDEGGLPYTEIREEIDEYSPLQMSYTEDTNLFSEESSRTNPLIVSVQGTMVGNDADIAETYGRPLKMSLYRSLEDSVASWSFEPSVSSQGLFKPDELRTETIASYLKIGGYQKAITKTGNVYVSIPRSSAAGPLGDGHSLHADLQGSLKASIGAEGSRGNSVYLTTRGSIKAIVGAGQQNQERGEVGRSVDLVTASGVNLEIKGTDLNEASLRIRAAGKSDIDIGRDANTTVRGSNDLLVYGANRVNVLGKQALSVTGDRHATVGGDWKNVVTGKVSNQIGSGRKILIASPGTGVNADSLTVLAGNRAATLTLGNDLTTVTAGNMVDTIAAGNKTTSIGTGTYTVNVGAGAISVTTASGAVTITTAAGALSLAASGVVQITGGVINVTGGSVNLGAAPAGGVVTGAHPCLVTGLPHIGSTTVRATP
tara:strand:+ start:2516 stop:4150 length:1635 start_codon:yes stop_codon:yes gene_type:complete